MAKIHNISIGQILFFRFFQVANRSLNNATNRHAPLGADGAECGAAQPEARHPQLPEYLRVKDECV